MKRIHVYYSGRVHGVGFRYTAVDLALKHKVKGWVKNTSDGRVEVVVEGKEKDVDDFLFDLKQQMDHYISEESIYSEPASGEFPNFDIAY